MCVVRPELRAGLILDNSIRQGPRQPDSLPCKALGPFFLSRGYKSLFVPTSVVLVSSFEMAAERFSVPIALAAFMMEFCRLRHIRGVTRAVDGTTGESITLRFHWADFHSNWSLNGAIYTWL